MSSVNNVEASTSGEDPQSSSLQQTSESSGSKPPGPRNSAGWDGKLRVTKQAVLANPQALSDPEYSDEDAPPVEQIAADEDLLDDYPVDETDIDLTHRGIVSIPALRLERFQRVRQLCLRQNQISHLDLPDSLGPTLVDLDVYDNLIAHIRGLDLFENLTSLDLSYNKIKHIKNVGHLTKLTDIYFVQNKIGRIENLETLTSLRNLELASNRIREIENLDTLTNLEELWLGKNKITELKNLGSLSKLKILSIQSNRLTSLSGVEELPNLEELYVTHNALTSIGDHLRHSTKLRVLDISANKIERLEGLEKLPALEDFWASDNLLRSFPEVEKQLRDKADLETVYFEGNPLQRENEVTYRNKIRLALPHIKQIDATFVQVS